MFLYVHLWSYVCWCTCMWAAAICVWQCVRRGWVMMCVMKADRNRKRVFDEPCCLFVQTCESAFATKDRLRAHMIRHEDKVPCHICGKLLSPAYITDHMRVHNQSQHHVCHLCNRSEYHGLFHLGFEKRSYSFHILTPFFKCLYWEYEL